MNDVWIYIWWLPLIKKPGIWRSITTSVAACVCGCSGECMIVSVYSKRLPLMNLLLFTIVAVWRCMFALWGRRMSVLISHGALQYWRTWRYTSSVGLEPISASGGVALLKQGNSKSGAKFVEECLVSSGSAPSHTSVYASRPSLLCHVQLPVYLSCKRRSRGNGHFAKWDVLASLP